MTDQAIKWTHVAAVEIDDRARYLVKTNGDEWRDNDLLIMPGIAVKALLRPQIMRGRPKYVALINRPGETA